MGSAIDPEILRGGIMIPLIVGAGIIGKFLYDINESHSMEEEAEEKRLEAIAREAEGWLLQKQEAGRMQRRLNNIVRKRQAIMEYTLPGSSRSMGKSRLSSTNPSRRPLFIRRIWRASGTCRFRQSSRMRGSAATNSLPHGFWKAR